MSGESSCPPRKVRRLSGYNCWHRQFLQLAEGSSLSSLSEKKNKISGPKWRELTNEEKKEYNEMAQKLNEEGTCSPASEKKEMKRALSSLMNIAEHMKKLDCEMMFTIVKRNDHYCGGTEKGVNYLQKEIPWLPYSFIGSLAKPDDFKTRKAHHRDDTDSSSLRIKVKKLFNHLYGVAVKKSNVRLPYSKIKEYGISAEGLPEDKDLKHPSSYGKKMLQAILDNSASIIIKVQHPPEHHVIHKKPASTCDITPSASMFLSPISSNAAVDLSVQSCLPSCSLGYILPAELKDHHARVVKPQSTNPLHHDHMYFNESQPKTKQKTLVISKKQ